VLGGGRISPTPVGPRLARSEPPPDGEDNGSSVRCPRETADALTDDLAGGDQLGLGRPRTERTSISVGQGSLV
jgi:hypothetical protein